MRSKSLLDVAQYPQITFRSSQILPDGARWVISGEVTAHGTTQPVDVVLDEAGVAGDQLTAHAVAHLDRYAFGVTKVKGMASRHLTLDFDLVAAATE